MSVEQMIKNILLKAKKDIKTAGDLFQLKHYDWSLFIWHLAIEKVFKAKILTLKKQIRFIHDLTHLAKEAGISLDEKLIYELNEITSFNLEARYDDYKLSFYNKATKEYTQKWITICKRIYLTIINSL